MNSERRAAYERLRAAITRGGAAREHAMQTFVEIAWRELASTGVSWIGFYVEVPDAPEPQRLVLAAREPKPACSPIGLHGACGQCLRAAAPMVVRNVADLGAGYIACDPRDRSEVVLPCLDDLGRAWAVLDLDSHDLASFDEEDAAILADLLRRAGLSQRSVPAASSQ